jgi:hypothetical protein
VDVAALLVIFSGYISTVKYEFWIGGVWAVIELLAVICSGQVI